MNWIYLIVGLVLFGAFRDIHKKIDELQRNIEQSRKDVVGAIEDLKS